MGQILCHTGLNGVLFHVCPTAISDKPLCLRRLHSAGCLEQFSRLPCRSGSFPACEIRLAQGCSQEDRPFTKFFRYSNLTKAAVHESGTILAPVSSSGKVEWPAKLRAYVEKTFDACKTPADREEAERLLKGVITYAKESNQLWTRNWLADPPILLLSAQLEWEKKKKAEEALAAKKRSVPTEPPSQLKKQKVKLTKKERKALLKSQAQALSLEQQQASIAVCSAHTRHRGDCRTESCDLGSRSVSCGSERPSRRLS